MSTNDLETTYALRHEKALLKIAERLENLIKELLDGQQRIDRIAARAKSPTRFVSKANKTENGEPKYKEPLSQIQDQIGARIITFYVSDIEPISKKIEGYFAPIEKTTFIPDSVNEFGYEGKHYIFFIPKDIVADLPEEHCPTFFELQIKTLFEHSWAEANHDLAYKPQSKLSTTQRRKIAFTAAQAWGADNIFDDLFHELQKN